MAADTPSGYTSGQLTIPAGSAKQLGPLIQAQIDANAAMAAFMVTQTADAGNGGAIFFGQDATVSATKYGATLAAGASRTLGGGTGNNILHGRMYVFSTGSTVLHIEIFP
jgi:hypothetical protein